MERGKLVMSGTIAELGQKMGARKMSVKWRNDDDKALEILKREREEPRNRRPRRNV